MQANKRKSFTHSFNQTHKTSIHFIYFITQSTEHSNSIPTSSSVPFVTSLKHNYTGDIAAVTIHIKKRKTNEEAILSRRSLPVVNGRCVTSLLTKIPMGYAF